MRLEMAAKQLEALGNPTRLAIFRTLIQVGDVGSTVGAIRNKLQIPGSTLSHHIAKLVQAGLVTQERDSRSLFCKADYGNMNSLIAYLVENCCTENTG